MSALDFEVLNAARRTLNVVKRMRLAAVRSAQPELKEFIDGVMAEEECRAGSAIEHVLDRLVDRRRRVTAQA